MLFFLQLTTTWLACLTVFRSMRLNPLQLATHPGVRCDVSGMYPIVGPRYNKKGEGLKCAISVVSVIN